MNQTAVNASAGFIGSIITYAFGGWNELLIFLLIAIGIDYGTGITAAIKEGNLNSEVGWWGLMKKILMVVAVFFAHRADIALELNVLMNGALYAFIANESISIIENYGRLGLPLPKQFKDMIAVLKNREDGRNG
ncbi:holin family protein [Paenibacillus alvei]|uniref:phage holin family protein n=1 Tax=Paenibacillus alvei TaxID=44250 RepID=UPI002280D294|nr:phage holin family protein [Paenibacillus alvei]MCY7485826.1 phage holin family protein [Paenibacillus alvei]